MRGAGWGRKHATVDYVFTHDPSYLVAYHYLVMQEMKKRGYSPDIVWYNQDYRGKTLGLEEGWVKNSNMEKALELVKYNQIIYPEHNDEYLKECLNILKSKGIEIDFKE